MSNRGLDDEWPIDTTPLSVDAEGNVAPNDILYGWPNGMIVADGEGNICPIFSSRVIPDSIFLRIILSISNLLLSLPLIYIKFYISYPASLL